MTEATEDEGPPKDRSFRVGDHVYVAPPYSQRPAGDPYLVARIVSLPPTEPDDVPKAKLAYYLRRRDVTNRLLADHRILFATFMAGLVPLSHIRKKCYVMHRDYLEDPEAFKREDDSFVFFQIYDRFMHKPFDLIPSSQVMNAPDDVLAHLKTGYEFVCTEVGSTAQLCDAMQGCVSCHAHAAKEQSVTCAICSRTWHLGCLDPPLLKKPALGWHWSCIKCTMAKEEEEDDEEEEAAVIVPRGPRTIVPKPNRNFETFRQKKKIDWKMKGQAVEPQLDISKWKMTNGWPYRYFGQHVDQRNTLDPHDPIWPRASTRVGSKFQQTPIPGEEAETPVARKPQPKRGFKRKTMTEDVSPEDAERGEEQACTPLWTAATSKGFTEEQLDEYIRAVKEAPIYRQHSVVDVLEWSLKLLADSSTEIALEKVNRVTLADLSSYASVANWTATDRHNFKRNIDNYNDELLDFRRNLSRKSMPQIVHFYYREEGYKRQYLSYEDPLAKDKLIAAETVRADKNDEDESVEASSLAGSPPPTATRKSKRLCAFCSTEESDRWYKCPDNLGERSLARKGKTLCSSCAIQWRHYGNPGPALSSAEAEYRAAKDKMKKRPLEKVAETSANAASEPRSPSLQPSETAISEPVLHEQIDEAPKERKSKAATAEKPAQRVKSCVICKRPEPKQSNFTCSSCGISVHSGCYGIAYAPKKGKYLCDMCDSRDADTSEKPPRCALCPPLPASDSKTAMDALKRTDGAEYIHLICSIWHYEIVYRDTFALDVAEGARAMHPSKLNKPCCLCRSSESGACLKCDLCDLAFHVSCAWRAGYRFAFEVLPVVEERLRDVPICRFKAEEGLMRPIVICKGHAYNPTRQLYDAGSKDKKIGLTAIMAYSAYYKGLDVLSSYPVLLEIRKREQLTASALVSPSSTTAQHAQSDPDNMVGIFGSKKPRVPKSKAANKRSATAPMQEQKADSEAEDPSVPKQQVAIESLPIVPGSSASTRSSAAISYDEDDEPKRKRQRRKRLSSEEARAALESLSEDEVMPSASTRSRQSTRVVRSVKKADILASTLASSTVAALPNIQGVTKPESASVHTSVLHRQPVPPDQTRPTMESAVSSIQAGQEAPPRGESVASTSADVPDSSPAGHAGAVDLSTIHTNGVVRTGPAAPPYTAPSASLHFHYSTDPHQKGPSAYYMPQANLAMSTYQYTGHNATMGQPTTHPTYNVPFHTSQAQSSLPSPAHSSPATNNLVREPTRSPSLSLHIA